MMRRGKTGDELDGSQFDGVEVRLERQANYMMGKKVRQEVHVG